ncbi:unnamed protein product [marine sediment metagenome]|uniref:Uncharacterized protein n=1 Tax=marine sediment metagenome TaxID=412755 RepID=X1L4J6_9ZZZZ
MPGAAPPQDFLNDPSVLSEDVLSLYAKYLVNLCIWTGGILALAGLIYGGILYLISTGKPDRMALAKNQITGAFFGLLILLSSYLILKTLSPQFINLKIPALQPITVIDRPTIPSPPTKELRTSINVEIPFGTIIEKWGFEGTVPWEQGKRIPRIKSNVETTREITDNLLNQSKDLKNYSDACECFGNTLPDPRCNYYGCPPCPRSDKCTCDPCKPVRGKIQNTESKNQTEINNLVVEQTKTEKEVRLLKEQLDKLERAEKFMLECYDWIDSLSDFLIKKTNFTENEWLLRKIKFWEEISIRGDWATFYCPVSGTIMGEAEYTVSAISPETMKELEEAAVTEISEPAELTACTTGIPVGEIIDRTKRTTKLLINKLEILVEKNKELIDAVDGLQVLVSQCSSRRCIPRCVCVSCGYHCTYCQEIGCFGDPCPSKVISDQLDEIQTIQKEIKDIIDGKGNNDTPADIGVVPIIEKVIPKILEDLEIIIRAGMQSCVSEIPSDISGSEEAFKNLMLLSNCESAIRGVGPEGIIIQNCCLEQDEFQECLGLCYLQEGDEKYKDCLQKCLEEKAKELEIAGFKEEAEIIKTCRHKLNFYCCGG